MLQSLQNHASPCVQKTHKKGNCCTPACRARQKKEKINHHLHTAAPLLKSPWLPEHRLTNSCPSQPQYVLPISETQKSYFFIPALVLGVSQGEWNTLESLPSYCTGKLKTAMELRGKYLESRKRPTVKKQLNSGQKLNFLHVILLSFHLTTTDNGKGTSLIMYIFTIQPILR